MVPYSLLLQLGAHVCWILETDGSRIDVPPLASALLSHEHPYKLFALLLSHSNKAEDPIPLLASAVLVRLLSTASSNSSKLSPKTEDALAKAYSYLSTLANSSDSGLQDIAVQEYSGLLRSRRSREIFWDHRDETVAPLIDVLRSAAGVGKSSEDGSTVWSGASTSWSVADSGIAGGVGLQLLYHILLVLWQLSFEGGLVGETLQQ